MCWILLRAEFSPGLRHVIAYGLQMPFFFNRDRPYAAFRDCAEQIISGGLAQSLHAKLHRWEPSNIKYPVAVNDQNVICWMELLDIVINSTSFVLRNESTFFKDAFQLTARLFVMPTHCRI
jgi:hypothetical protein